jgi:peptidoglycan/LPS O-acetylase OafA/YrhL
MTNNYLSENRLIKFDLIRSFAVVVILFHHLPSYSFNFYDLNHFGINLDLSEINNLNRYFGLGLFTFMLGYFVDVKGLDFSDRTILANFFRQKFLRIFPLYCLALLVFIVILRESNSLLIISHLFGLQLITATLGFEPIANLWFVGLVAVYYVQYIALRSTSLLAEKNQTSAFNNFKFMIRFLVVFTPFWVGVLNKMNHAIDVRIAVYFGPFWLGYLCCKYLSIEKLDNRFRQLCFPILVALYFVFCSLTGTSLNNFAKDFFIIDNFSLFILKLLFVNCLMLSLILFVTYFSEYLSEKTQGSFLATKVILILSYSSYCMYLFHMPVWYLMAFINRKLAILQSDSILFTLILILIGIPLVVFMSFVVQRVYDKSLMPRILKTV